MARMVKTANEIAAMIMTASGKVGQCEGLTGVTVQRIDDEERPFNWTVSVAHNSLET
jgi:hypothetical protein